MAQVRSDMSDGITMASSAVNADGATVLTLAGPEDTLTLVLDEHALREIHRETGPDRTALGETGPLVEVRS